MSLTAFVLLLLMSPVAFAQDWENSLVVEVKEAAGRPLKNACVTFVPKEGEIIFRKADGKGHVRLKKLTPGSYRVVVKIEGYEAQKKEVTVNSHAESVAFLMQPRRQ